MRNLKTASAALILMLVIPATLLADAKSDGDRGIAEYNKGNLINAMQLLEKSATGGYAPAQTMLAYIFDTAEENAKAFYWYQQAADSLDAEGLFGLGRMYAKGEGTSKDQRKAGNLIRQSAELGHAQASRVYAHALEIGQLGYDVQLEMAAKWYLRAADLGDLAAIKRLKDAYTLGQLGLPVDLQQAKFWNGKLSRSE